MIDNGDNPYNFGEWFFIASIIILGFVIFLASLTTYRC